MADRFSMEKFRLWDSFLKVVLILNRISPNVIKWLSLDYIEDLATKYYHISDKKLRNVIGAIDGTFIPIKTPKLNAEVYITRKRNYAVTLQAVCDSNLKFIDCYTRWPDSFSDRRIFNNSDIYKHVSENKGNYFPDNFFIVADKVYPVLRWCNPPYIDNGILIEKKSLTK